NYSIFRTGATFKWQGYDGSQWTDVTGTLSETQRTNNRYRYDFSQTGAQYSRYRLLGVSGNTYYNRLYEMNLFVGSGFIASLYPKHQCTADADGDNVYNHLDLDSDGDGCSDALEAGATLDITADYVFAATPDVNTNGLNDTVEDGTSGSTDYDSIYGEYALEAEKRACADSDGDSIIDLVDADDDNDGILDIHESICDIELATTPADLSWHGSAAGNMSTADGTTLSVSGAAWANAYSDQVFDLPLRIEGTVTAAVNGMIGLLPENGTETTSWNDGGYKFQFNRSNGMYVRHGNLRSGWHTPSIVGTTFRLEIDGDGNMKYIHNGNEVYSGTLPVGNYKLTISRGSFTVDNFQVVQPRTTTNPNECTSLDTDGDGLPNRLDLDSDGDGCPDALEGSLGLLISAAVSSSMDGGNTGSGFTGTAGPVIKNLGTTVDANGVPTIAGSGQQPGDGLDINTNVACPDNDGDSINDWVDLDDDNDGILDVDEGCEDGSAAHPFTHLNRAYWVSPGRYHFDFGNGVFQADVDNTEGKGWVLILQYIHQGGTNPDLTVIPAGQDFPVTSTAALGTNESGTNGWGHAGNAAMAQLTGAEEFRFYAETNGHNRIIHFKTTSGLDYSKTGTGSFTGINTNFTALTGHTANIPAGVTNYYSNKGDLALTDFPYWRHGTWHWGIRGLGRRWEVDDYPGNSSRHTIHRIWVRSANPANSMCTVDYDNDGTVDAMDVDSDDDGCPDAVEGAGNFSEADLTDSNNLADADEGTVDDDGVPTNSGSPQDNHAYVRAKVEASITTQPEDVTVFVGNETLFDVAATDGDLFQWQVSTDGGTTFSDITDDDHYTGTTTDSLTLKKLAITMNGWQYRVLVASNGSYCMEIPSEIVTLSVRVATVITNRRITYRVKKGN
ncbi:MAG: hypothetical protein AB3N16_14460, partial [Flavobacteriaceae bacterium]